MKNFLIVFLIFFLAPVFFLSAETSQSTGFVDGYIWTVSEIEKDKKIKLYTVLFNGENSLVDFSVEFFDGSESLGKTDISIWPKEAKAVSIDWMVTSGRHSIYAKIISARMNGSEIEIRENNTKKITTNVRDSGLIEESGSKIEKKDDNQAQTQLSELIEKLNFKKDSFGDRSKVFVLGVIEEIEFWRLDKKANFQASVEKLKESRKGNINAKPEIKAMSFLHLAVVSIIKFVFSVGLIFYGLGIILSILIIKKIFRFLSLIFRKNPELA